MPWITLKRFQNFRPFGFAVSKLNSWYNFDFFPKNWMSRVKTQHGFIYQKCRSILIYKIKNKFMVSLYSESKNLTATKLTPRLSKTSRNPHFLKSPSAFKHVFSILLKPCSTSSKRACNVLKLRKLEQACNYKYAPL